MIQDSKTSKHGTAISIYGWGVLLIGASSIGKTELALELIDRGHKLVADDMVMIEKMPHQTLLMFPDNNAIGYVHIRGIGFINIASVYNMFDRVATSSKLDLVIHLVDDKSLISKEPSQHLAENILILDIPILQCTLPTGRSRNLVLLTELIVKYYKQIQDGHNPNLEFIHKHNILLQ